MARRKYQASGQMNDGALGLLLLASLGTGIAIGLVEGYVSQWFNLLVIFPMVLGLGVGFAVGAVVEKKHVRAPLLAVGLAVAGAASGYASVHATQYSLYRDAVLDAIRADVAAQGGNASAVNDDLLDDLLEKETGSSGFIGYMKASSKQGTQIRRFGASSGLKMDGALYWIMLLVDLGLAVGGAGYVVFGAATTPYCENCRRWYDTVESLQSGSADKEAVNGTIDALSRGSFAEVGQTLGYPTRGAASLLQLKRCQGCASHEPLLTYTVITNGGKKQKERWSSIVTAEDATILAAAVIPSKSPASAPPKKA